MSDNVANKITVLLVDDHSLVRRGFRRILEDETDLAVIGEAGDGAEAVRLAKELQPRVIVMDCALPSMNGLDATRKILGAHPDTAVLMLSMHPEDQFAVRLRFLDFFQDFQPTAAGHRDVENHDVPVLLPDFVDRLLHIRRFSELGLFKLFR